VSSERESSASGHGHLGTAVAIILVTALVYALAAVGVATTAVSAQDSSRQKSGPGQRPPSGDARPIGSMNDVMRGILFPNSNRIFNVQVEDPASTPPVGSETTSSLISWGERLYGGWPLVSYAAVALEESTALLLKPGRRCENGRTVPVSNPDWIRYTNELGDTARAIYAASQARDRETIVTLTGRLTDACANCHSVYRRRTAAERCIARD
jgi:hypothetical protein